MKIIIIGPAYPFRGGIADTNESLALSLQQEGHEVTIVTFTVQYPSILFPGKSQFSEDPAPIDLKIKRLINSVNPFNWPIVARKINKESPDLVIFRFWTPLLSPALGSIARLLSKKTKKIALCDNIIPHEKKLGDKALIRYFLSPFQGFITMSEQVKNELSLFSNKPVMVHPHPINLNLGEACLKPAAKNQLGLDENTNYLLFFGLVRKYKGLDLMLKAMANPELKKHNIKLLIAGEFYDNPKEYEKMITELRIEEMVEIRNKFIPTEEIKLYFSASDMVTQTYHTASQSGITQMALNFNKPILVTDVGGLSEIVVNGKSGYVVDKTPEAIATAIDDFYMNEQEAKFSERAKEEKKKYSWSSLSNALIAFSDKLN